MKSDYRVLVLMALMSFCSGAIVAAQDTPPRLTPLTPQELAIRKNAELFVNAFNKRDAKEVALLFTADSQMSHNGELIAEGREAIDPGGH